MSLEIKNWRWWRGSVLQLRYLLGFQEPRQARELGVPRFPLPRWSELHVLRLGGQKWSRSVLETVTDVFAEVEKI